MTDELLHLGPHETLRVLSEAPEQLDIEATWEPGGSAPPPHFHPEQDEHFEVASGRLTAVVDGRTHHLGPGDTLQIGRGVPHKMWNGGNEPATAVWRTRPAGRTLDWFRTIDRLGEGGTRNPPLPEMAKAVTEYSDVIQLAPGPKPLWGPVRAGLKLLGRAG